MKNFLPVGTCYELERSNVGKSGKLYLIVEEDGERTAGYRTQTTMPS
jgi:hypothetical protein